MSGDTSVLEHYLKPLRASLDLPGVTELVVNRPGEFALERDGVWSWHEAPELTEAWLKPLAVAAAAVTSQDVTADLPICSTVLPTGERCQIVLPPAAEHLSLTLRKASEARLDLDDFARAGLFDAVTVATDDLTPDEIALLALRDAGDWRSFFQAAVGYRRCCLSKGELRHLLQNRPVFGQLPS